MKYNISLYDYKGLCDLAAEYGRYTPEANSRDRAGWWLMNDYLIETGAITVLDVVTEDTIAKYLEYADEQPLFDVNGVDVAILRNGIIEWK